MEHYKTIKKLFSNIKNGQDILTFGDIEIIKIEKNKFYWYKSPAILGDVDINNFLVSSNILF